MNISTYKNAFQWDAYRPLIDRIPARTVAGGYLLGGVPAGGTCQGVYLPGGVPARKAYLLGGAVYLSGGCTCLGTPPPTWTDRHV